LNVAAPLMMQHVLGMGVSYAVVRNLELSLAYSHAFKNKISGPAGLVAENTVITDVTNEVYANVFLAGISKKW
jgi:long-subunit fatty acid transport protein